MKKIYLIDGNSFIYRMFFGLPEFATKDGKVVNAIFGMAKFFIETLVKQQPDYLVFITDPKGDNFRSEIYADYKATRDRMPDNLRTQIDDIYDMIRKMGIDIIQIDGYEADDVIGTLAVKLSKEEENQIYILSGDKDLYSLISDNIFVYDTMKKKIFDKNATKEKFGVDSNCIIDYLAIVGDKADNIPGVDGFGPKKAVDLINQLGSIDVIYEIASNIHQGEKSFQDLDVSIQSYFKGKTFEKLLASQEAAFLSKQLATIVLDVNLPNFDLENYKFIPDKYLNDEVKNLFKKYEFFSLLGESDQMKTKFWRDLGLKVHVVDSDEKLKLLEEKIYSHKSKELTLDTETTSLNIIEADLLGVSIYLDDENIYYINRGHAGKQVGDKNLRFFLERLLESDLLIIGHNIKYDLQIIDLFIKYYGNKHEKEIQKSLF